MYLYAYSAGTYEHESKMNRKVDWHQSFGGSPINLPSVKQYSTIPSNTEKVRLHQYKDPVTPAIYSTIATA